MAWITDSLRSAIAAVNPFGRFGPQNAGAPGVFTHQLALAAYQSSGLLRKVIRIPADDRVREWRDWQAEKDQIAAIEAEEKRLGLVAKVRQAEVLRGIGGGALILVTAGDHSQPLQPDSLRVSGLIAINVVSRWQITAQDFVKDLASPEYGQPRSFRIDSDGRQQTVHPSRVVCFRGAALPAGSAMSDEDAFWGDSRLLTVMREVSASDAATGWFAELVKKAKLLRVGIPNLTEITSAPGGQAKLASRVALIAEGEHSLNATVYDAGSGQDGAGEKITDYQVSWAGIPAMMDAFDQRVAAVADIPFTRLMGRSPAGMNATGSYDDQNWAKAVSAGQQLETRPCLEQLDPILLRSAGVDPADVTWKWAPLWAPTEAEEAATFKTTMEAIEKLRGDGAIPEVALNKGVQNLLSEREWLPGLDQALAEVPENERFGLSPDDDGSEPSALQAGKEGDRNLEGGAGGSTDAPARRAANDAKPIPLYVQRKLLNAADLIRWAKAQGFRSTLEADDMHVTVLYSRTAVDPIKMGNGWGGDEKGNLTIRPGGPRAVEKLGDTAVVLLFASDDLSWRHRGMVEAGASHDFHEYQPHVTLTYEAGDVDLDDIKPFAGELRFGPELFEPLDLDWKSKVTETGE